MIGWTLVLVVVAVLLFTSPPRGRRMAGGLTADPPTSEALLRQKDRRPRLWWAATALAPLGLVVAYSLGGMRAVAVTTALLIIAATVARLSVQDLRARRVARARTDVAHACSVLASQIRVGRVPAEALHSAASDCPVLADASRVQDLGGDVSTAWRITSRRPGHAGLRDLARAWQMSSQTGAPLARSLEQVSEALTAEVALRTVVAGELAASRATGKIMAALPFLGLGMGYLLGGDPLHFLLSNAYGWACLVGGIALAAAGVLWIDWLSRLAAEQG